MSQLCSGKHKSSCVHSCNDSLKSGSEGHLLGRFRTRAQLSHSSRKPYAGELSNYNRGLKPRSLPQPAKIVGKLQYAEEARRKRPTKGGSSAALWMLQVCNGTWTHRGSQNTMKTSLVLEQKHRSYHQWSQGEDGKCLQTKHSGLVVRPGNEFLLLGELNCSSRIVPLPHPSMQSCTFVSCVSLPSLIFHHTMQSFFETLFIVLSEK